MSRLLYPDGHVGWLVTSHELARAVLGDPRFSIFPGGHGTEHPARRAALIFHAIQHDEALPDAARTLVDRYRQDGRLQDAFRDPVVGQAIREHPSSKLDFLTMDPPEQTRIRRIVAGHFTVRRVGELRPRVEQVIADRLDAMERVGAPVDLVEEFAQPIPSLMTCALFGLPQSERDTFERLTTARVNRSSTTEEFLDGIEGLRTFISELIERKRAQPTDDLLSTLVHSGETKNDEELVSTAALLIRAAHTSTASTLALAVLVLLQDRDQWDRLRNEPAAAGNIVEELLRYTTAFQTAFIRTALEDVEIGGTVIKAFETVVISLLAANRDPDVFTEPDRLDLTRRPAKHLAFGYGSHQCLGQHLARLELQVALTGLARRFPTLDLAVPLADVPLRSGDSEPHGVQQLPVTW